ncbi:hypothetical protein KLA_07861 [Cellulophaga geojensis KL-A]|uniref:DUF1361 domain-containing protein n=1 Tax=Cellulophaga geojensis KL-A TaxID=1328323 RepID=A0ABP3B7D5_9FLAO|nr:DUF1361 domain-containing protein [Cellulophaga geojensis]EWH13698.1 hypothetical protein KLA_07861 [Cellulophaga geojensis KL-A]
MKQKLILFTTSNIGLLAAISFAILILAVRIKITGSLFFSFLVWNLFLAGLPYLFSQVLKYLNNSNYSKIGQFVFFGMWLLFLPNSPYIITDLIHLQNENATLVWLDLLLLFVYAIIGLLLGLFSMIDVYQVLKSKYNAKNAHFFMIYLCLLCGYGVYLGRFLRFNSWDLFTKPHILAYNIAHSLTNYNVWSMTFAFGGLLYILFWTLHKKIVFKK